ncbi:MAG: hypothetical protein E6K80_13260, partial [Candidatus Eisenbacteria bacterium]
MSLTIERLRDELLAPGHAMPGAAASLASHVALWEDLLTLVVDPATTRVPDGDRKRRLLSFLLE